MIIAAAILFFHLLLLPSVCNSKQERLGKRKKTIETLDCTLNWRSSINLHNDAIQKHKELKNWKLLLEFYFCVFSQFVIENVKQNNGQALSKFPKWASMFGSNKNNFSTFFFFGKKEQQKAARWWLNGFAIRMHIMMTTGIVSLYIQQHKKVVNKNTSNKQENTTARE